MPILAHEPCLYPETLLEEFTPAEHGRCWQVYHTKARQEKAVARDLLAFEVPFYLPLVRKTFACGARRFSSHVPLFSGYVFVCASEEERFAGMISRRLAQVLRVPDPFHFWQQLCQIRQLIESGAPLTVESRLAPGLPVRVRRGPLAGLEGVVLKRHSRTRLLVQVNFLQQGASVDIDDFLLEPIA